MKQATGRSDSGSGKFAQVDAILAKYQDQRGTLIPILQDVQQAYGYLPKDVIMYMAEKTGVPASQIYGVATFYAQFHLNPRGRHVVRVCRGTACHVRGSKLVLEAIEKKLGVTAGGTTADQRFTLETVACIGACGLAPVMMVDDDTHGRLTPEMVDEILAQYK